MRSKRTSARYRSLYARLVRLYPAPFRDRFGEQLVQTFGDLCRERQQAGRGLLGLVLRTFAETLAAIARERSATMNPWQNPYVRVALGTVVLLMIPLVAMRFTDVVAWDRTDFLVAGALLFGAGAAFVLIARRTSRPGYRAAVGLAVGTGLLLTWMNLAVGLIGSDDNPANLRWQNKDAASVELHVAEERSWDNETAHSGEDVGYLLIE
jgi:hypothetical protein